MRSFINLHSWFFTIACVCNIFLSVAFHNSYGQQPVFTVRFANPEIDCDLETYCVDVEFQSDTPDTRLSDMNVRFLYDDELLIFQSFCNFVSGYDAASPNPPFLSPLPPGAGSELFGFADGAVYVNGAIQLTNPNAPPIFISTTGWTLLFSIRFSIQGLATPSFNNICPSLIWDLRLDPSQGGYAPGSEGVVITIVNPLPNNPSLPVTENVVQFNWEYSQNGGIPYGYPVETYCLENSCGDDSIVILPGHQECFQSGDAIVVGGNPPTFTVEPDGAAFLISPISVTLLPGVHIKTGAYFRGWISDEDCSQPLPMLAISDEEVPGIVKIDHGSENRKLFKVFPNPTSHILNLELLHVCEASTAIAEIYNASGKRIIQKQLVDNPLYQFNLSPMPPGIYIIRVICNDLIETEKVIKN